ncbi:hypothetical protein OH146_03195 [Salinibacterium sp. SYSU T00001]|uniref:hypothetical protein n=1 Tax=Homoserinimonas sedimenticola TaxID=2986805 RepID=UPI002236B180|nr:hypothetical protein [Salinibacterium sedimenticola]MCW4384775.1 hypothetical protein [Salinibacterium sedimenticola]
MRRMLWPAPAALALLLLTACAPATTGPSPSLAPPSSEIAIGLTEWDIVTGTAQAAAGEVRLLVTNAGATDHDLVVSGIGGTWATPELAPGEEYELLITASGGETLELDCSLTGHHAQGMYAELAVAMPGE